MSEGEKISESKALKSKDLKPKGSEARPTGLPHENTTSVEPSPPEESKSSPSGSGFRASWKTPNGRMVRVPFGHSGPNPITQELIDALDSIESGEGIIEDIDSEPDAQREKK